MNTDARWSRDITAQESNLKMALQYILLACPGERQNVPIFRLTYCNV